MNTQLNTGLLKMGVGLQTFKDNLFAKTLTLKSTPFTQLVGMGVLELVHVTFVLSMSFLAYFLVRNLPIDNILAIALSVGVGLVAAYKIYGVSNTVVSVLNDDTTHRYEFSSDDEFDFGGRYDPAFSRQSTNVHHDDIND